MSKKLAVIISSIAAAVVAVVGVVFAGVWGTNTGVNDNIITVGTPATVVLDGSAVSSKILPGAPVETGAYTVSIDLGENAQATYKLVLTKDAETTADLANFKVQVKVNDEAYGEAMSLADTVVLAEIANNNDKFTLKFTLDENTPVEQKTLIFKFDLKLEQNA